jgi:hypothetical protein
MSRFFRGVVLSFRIDRVFYFEPEKFLTTESRRTFANRAPLAGALA